MFVSPVPHMLEKLLACQVAFFDALGSELCNDLGFRGYGRMVSTGNPQRVFAKHARTANEYILDGVVEHMAHMKHACDIGRRYDYGIWFTSIRHALKQVML